MSPELSVVVASVNGMPYLGACLRALADHAPNIEVIVADWTDESTRNYVREHHPSVNLLSFDEPATVPELRAAGIFTATAPYVAVIEDHCNVTPAWSSAAIAAHKSGHAVVGGPIRNVMTRRVRDWAPFFCEYSSFIEPLSDGPARDVPGMNASYDRRALEAMADLLREGRWESDLHPRLHTRGLTFWCATEMTIDHAKDFGFREFASQRYHYSRSYAGMRNASLGSKRWLYAAGSPALLPLAFMRVVRNVRSRPAVKPYFRKAAPLIAVYCAIWAFGEGVGYAFGGGRSILKVR